ncbi:interferon regulatory factor 8-like isoform X2 [Gigantopelta aegis]|uniref:interferon regulatory factor 8-like isoform X2 n=1 Tax=Gigantopelta aegis TaxID=1735272 RepID=UPI001B88CF86|nr:interferon regulatory factor 8-like isoform X2 [Gigantopelta aegis]
MSEPHNRQRLRPWLEEQINRKRFPGVQWLSEKEKIFKLPWKHGGKQDWQESDSLIFKEWAIHTGRFREGIDTPDWPSWKTRLRCALNKMPDIKEIKKMGNLDGPEPFRVYQFLPKKGNASVSSQSDNDDIDNSSMDVKIEPNNESVVPRPLNNIPTFVSESFACEDKDGHVRSLDQDLKNIDVCDLIGVSHTATTNDNFAKDEAMETDENTVIEEGSFPTDHNTGAPTKITTDSCLSILDFMTDETNTLVQPGENEFIIRIKYRNKVVGQHQVKFEGCRLFYGPPVDSLPRSEEQVKIFGPPTMEQIHFPPCTELSNLRQERLTTQLLNVLDRGLLLHCEDRDIYATRKCRLVIFVVPANSSSVHPVKLERDGAPVKIFDFAKFVDRLQKYQNGAITVQPSAEVLVGFGQDWKSENNPSNNLLISASVFHSLALFYLAKFSMLDYPLQVSKSDDWDQLVDKLKELVMKNPPTK